jgi:hypothetical protein
VTDPLRIYRRWFLAAAVYNVAWGLVVLTFPQALLHLADIHDRRAAPLVGVIGMLVGVYGYGYYLLARNPLRYAPFIWIGLAGRRSDQWGSSGVRSRVQCRGASAGCVCSTT